MIFTHLLPIRVTHLFCSLWGSLGGAIFLPDLNKRRRGQACLMFSTIMKVENEVFVGGYPLEFFLPKLDQEGWSTLYCWSELITRGRNKNSKLGPTHAVCELLLK
jgi:hypothetical protein